MANKRTGLILQHLRQLAAANAPAELTDRQLLEQFVDRQDQAAFEALLRRHGRMVLSVATRVLSNVQDAEDVLQATFLTLARRASSIRKRNSAASWLHGVAVRIAMKTRTKAAQRHASEKQKRCGTPSDPPSDPLAELTGKEICRMLDEELNQLPEACRGAVILCLLEGKTRDEAALHLGMSLGTLRRRLEQGRDLLHTRLRRRGLALSIVLCAATVLEATASAAVPVGIAAPTVKAATLLVAGKLITGVISARVIALTEGMVNAMLITKFGVATILVAGILVMAAAGTQGFNSAGAEQPHAPLAKARDAAAPTPPRENGESGKNSTKTDKELLQGMWAIVGTVEEGKEQKGIIGGMEFVGDKLVMTSALGRCEYTVTLDGARRPKWIDITFIEGKGFFGSTKGEKTKGIYRLDGNMLTICLPAAEKERPTEFVSKAGSGRTVATLQRLCPPDDNAPKKPLAPSLEEMFPELLQLDDLLFRPAISKVKMPMTFSQGQRFQFPYAPPGAAITFAIDTPTNHYVWPPKVDMATSEGRKAIYQALRDAHKGGHFTMDGNRLLVFGGARVIPLSLKHEPLRKCWLDAFIRISPTRFAEFVKLQHAGAKVTPGPIDSSYLLPLLAERTFFAALTNDDRVVLLVITPRPEQFQYDVGHYLLEPVKRSVENAP